MSRLLGKVAFWPPSPSRNLLPGPDGKARRSRMSDKGECQGRTIRDRNGRVHGTARTLGYTLVLAHQHLTRGALF